MVPVTLGEQVLTGVKTFQSFYVACGNNLF